MTMKIRSIVLGFLLALATPLAALAQCSGQAPANTYCGNPTGALALPGWKPMGGFAVDLDVGTTTITGGTTTAPLFNNGGVLGNGSISSTWSTFLQAGTNAVSRTAQAKLRDKINVSDFATVTDAINAVKANNGGTLEFTNCGTYTLGTALSAAAGIDTSNVNYPVKIVGPGGPNGGSVQCVMLEYVGTGSMFKANGSLGFEVGGFWIRGVNAARIFDLATGSTTNTTFPYIHDNMIIGGAGTLALVEAASTVSLKVVRSNFAGGLVGIRGITSGAGIAGGQFMVGAEISGNTFQPTLTTAAIQGMETATVSGNKFQGQLLGYASGPALTCQTLNWLGNWHGDATTPQSLIQSNCRNFNSEGTTYSQAGGVAITQANSTGIVNSTGDFFSVGTWIAMGTGNLLNLKSQEVTGIVPVVTGTPATSPAAQIVYGQLGIGTATITPQAPLTVASRGTAVNGNGIALVASDFGTTGGTLSINKDAGAGSSVHIVNYDTGVIGPIVFDSGDVRLGGTFAGNRIGVLRFNGGTTGAVIVTPQAAAGTPTLTLPTTTGTFAVSATSPLALSATTGVLTIASIPLSSLATQATNTVVGNATSGTAVPTALAVGSCSTSASALIWTTNTGFGCNTSINAATLGGATFASPGTIGGGTPGLITGTQIVGTLTIDAPAIRAAGTLSNIKGTTGSDVVTLFLAGGSGAAGGSYIGIGKNTAVGTTHYAGHFSAVFASGTSSNYVLYNTGSAGGLAGLVYNASYTDNSVAFASVIDATSGTVGAINTLGGIGVTKNAWVGGNIVVGTAARTLTLKQGANGAVGTFTCVSASNVTVNNTFVAANDNIMITYESGTAGASAPNVNTKTAATSFRVGCLTGDTAVYNYVILKSAA